MEAQLLDLGDPALNLAAGGGKAANLQRLVAAGFPVPAGFVIPTAAYRAYVALNGLAEVISAQTAATDAREPDSFERASQAIRQRFEQGDVPPDLRAAVEQAYAGLGPDSAVAVRSSATAEDLPETSFAGQQETYLNVRGKAALMEAVRRCWSSLWTARAMAYRARQAQADPQTVALAVVVQTMVPAQAAGVLFTVNPLTGNQAEAVVNAAWGLGEALVAGQVNPDTLVVDKASGRLKSVEVGDKAVMTAAEAQGTAEVPVDDARRRAQVLTAAQAGELARLAAQIEALFGRPQDIEWALADGRFHVLQARPVTALALAADVPGDDAWPPPAAAEPQPYDVWTQADVGERWPEPVTPFTWSTFERIMNDNMRDSLGYLKAPSVMEGQWARRAFGRIYFNEGLMAHVFATEFGMPASTIAASLGSQAAPASDRWKWGLFLRRLPLLMRQGRKMDEDIRLFEARFPDIEQWVDEFMQRDLGAMTDEALWREATGPWWSRMMEHMALHASSTSVSMMNFGMLENLVGGKEAAHALITGLNGIIQAEIVPALREMAREAERLGLGEVVLSAAEDPARALAQLRADPGARPLLDRLDEFLRRHGHRCASEAEWRYPRWREAPELVVEMLAGYVRGGPGPSDSFAPAREREAATAEVAARLDPLRRALFRRLLPRVHHLVRMRDNGQHYLVKLVLPLRRIVAELAGRWAARGWLAAPDDFFFLAMPEIEQALEAGDPQAAGLDLRSIAAARRQAYEHWFGVAAPEVLDAHGQPVRSASGAANGALAGVAASRGRVTGTARIVHSPREAGHLQPGDILVTRATDPGWTPIFSAIGGLVLEVGGLLSHGAIVAREYGLPAVVNVPDATRRIRDGQTVTVDGTGGMVFLV